MALLNPPQILPSVARALFRALQSSDRFTMGKDELARLIVPPALNRAEDTLSGPGSKGFDDTLNACVMIGLFSRDANDVGLHPALPDYARDRRVADRRLRPLIRDLMLRDEINEGLWDSSEGGRDLTRAVAWYLSQSPLAPPMRWNEPLGVDTAQERQFESSERIFSNDTRWGAFTRWATFLGFGRFLPTDAKEVLVPDPTDALRDVLPTMLSPQRQEVLPVVEALGRRLPVLDGGRYRREVEARMRPGAVHSASDLLSPSLSHALLRLRDEGLILLENLADAPFKLRFAEGFGQERTVTHVSMASNQGRRRR